MNAEVIVWPSTVIVTGRSNTLGGESESVTRIDVLYVPGVVRTPTNPVGYGASITRSGNRVLPLKM